MAGRTHTIGVAMVDREERVVTRGECGWKPCGRGMARGTGCRPARREVIRIRGASEICLMARVAVRWCSREDVVDMALVASNGDVCAGELECSVVVIKAGPGP